MTLYPKTASLIAPFAKLYGLKAIRDPVEVANTKKQKILTKLTKIKSQKIRLLRKIQLYKRLVYIECYLDYFQNVFDFHQKSTLQ